VTISGIRTFLPSLQWNLGCAQPGQQAGHFLGITGGSKQGMDSAGPNRREKITQVEAQHNLLTDMRGSVGEDRPAWPKTGHGRRRWNSVQNLMQDLPLNRFQLLFGRFDQAKAATTARLPVANVMA